MKTQELSFSYSLLEEKDKPMVHAWLEEPHVQEFFYGDGLENTYKSIENVLQGKEPTYKHWVAYFDGNPFAFLMTSEVKKPKDELSKYCSLDGDAITLDLLIGDKSFTGKGMGPKLIRDFLKQNFAHITEVLIDPEVGNTRAIRAYEKVGFKKLEQFIPSWNPKPHWMMRGEIKAILNFNVR